MKIYEPLIDIAFFLFFRRINDFTLPVKPKQHQYVFLLLSTEFRGLWIFGFLSEYNMESEKHF